MPLGKLTPTIEPGKMLHAALALRDEMANCTLSDQAIALVAMRLNTGQSVAKLARGLGIREHNAYIMLRSQQAQQLMAELATSMLGDAAVIGVHTMLKIMKGRDPSLAYRAAETMMERAGLGISQRSTPDGATKTVFAFAFGAPQAVTHQATGVAIAGRPATDGTPQAVTGTRPALKNEGSRSGEAPAPVILEQLSGVRAGGPRGHKRSGQRGSGS